MAPNPRHIAEARLRLAAMLGGRAHIGLLDFVAATSRDYDRPTHLAPLVDVLERTAREPVFAVVHAPPRHGKTETVLHAIARRLLLDPKTRVGYASYAARLARNKSRRAQDMARAAGVALDPRRLAAHEWATTAGGGVFSAGRGGPFTGEGFDLIIVDDPYKNRAEAESQLTRDALDSWFRSTVLTRLEPGGSVVLLATRWHEDDLSGRLLAETARTWEEVTLPAVDDEGRALWPSRWSAEALAEVKDRVGELDWWSLFQGRPRPRGGTVFKGTYFYDEVPRERYRDGGGLDFAYTEKTSSDWSVLIEGRAVGGGDDAVLYLTNVEREQVRAGEWRERLRAKRRSSSARWCTYVTGPERGVVDLLDCDIEAINASADKLVRATPVSVAWNRGRVLVPHDAPWLDAFVSEMLSFTGAGDAHDDQVDALAGLWAAVGDTGAEVDII